MKNNNLNFDDFTYVVDDKASRIAAYSFIVIGLMIMVTTYLGMFP